MFKFQGIKSTEIPAAGAGGGGERAAVIRTDHMDNGGWDCVVAGSFILTMVVIKSIAPRIDEVPAKWREEVDLRMFLCGLDFQLMEGKQFSRFLLLLPLLMPAGGMKEEVKSLRCLFVGINIRLFLRRPYSQTLEVRIGMWLRRPLFTNKCIVFPDHRNGLTQNPSNLFGMTSRSTLVYLSSHKICLWVLERWLSG